MAYFTTHSSISKACFCPRDLSESAAYSHQWNVLHTYRCRGLGQPCDILVSSMVLSRQHSRVLSYVADLVCTVSILFYAQTCLLASYLSTCFDYK
ncbi:hypothetical protein BV25DRAFT_1664969 [Artomyces pyxidatus]|uniref:Uncharacterized protein n=1 Tax=Artomyces pyxidatus TaxID=48021 RepID=A0ACB8SIG7_9AGAM|nr:hypothetical protein BV25DRAFT_1664969 [Artomyces pyxidatus]